MAKFPDLLCVALFALAGPVIDYSLFWPAHRRLSQADPVWARRWFWASTIGSQWTLVAFGTALWMASNRSLTSLGFTVPYGWRLWVGIAVVMLFAAYQGWVITILSRSPEQREGLRQQFSALAAVLPHTRTELPWFAGVSLTAGFCEEFMYRGYFIWVFAPWIGWLGCCGTVPAVLRACARLPRMERRPPYGSRRRGLHTDRGDLRVPVAGDCLARPGRSGLWSHGVVGAARWTFNESRAAQ